MSQTRPSASGQPSSTPCAASRASSGRWRHGAAARSRARPGRRRPGRPRPRAPPPWRRRSARELHAPGQRREAVQRRQRPLPALGAEPAGLARARRRGRTGPSRCRSRPGCAPCRRRPPAGPSSSRRRSRRSASAGPWRRPRAGTSGQVSSGASTSHRARVSPSVCPARPSVSHPGAGVNRGRRPGRASIRARPSTGRARADHVARPGAAAARQRGVLHEEAVAGEQLRARPRPRGAGSVPSGCATQLCAWSAMFAAMIWSTICACTVGLVISTSVSIRRSRLRSIQSAEEMKTRASGDGRPWPLPKQTMRLCSRKRPMIDLTRMFSREPRDPGAQAADAAHHHVDLHPGLARGIERVDHLRVGDGVQLDPDLRRPPGAGVLDLGREPLEDARLDHVRARSRGSPAPPGFT